VDRRRGLGLLPLGELHPDQGKCALCGDEHSAKKLTVILSTNAVGYRCLDSVACVRRKARR